MNWSPDTCYCVIKCERPSKDGSFIKRCRIHPTTRKTTDVYQHNLTHRIKSTEQGSEAKEKIGDDRKRSVRESTKP